MATISILEKNRAPSRNVFCEGLGFKSLASSLLFSVVHFSSEKVALGVRGLNLDDIVFSTVDHRIKPRLDVGRLSIPVVLVALDEQYTKTVAISPTRSVVGDFGRRKIPGRVQRLHGNDVVLAAVDRGLELGAHLVLLPDEVVLGACDQEQTQVATTYRLRAHFEGLRRFGVVLIASSNEEQKPEKHERKHRLSDFHLNLLLLGLEMCYQATMTRSVYCLVI